MCQMDVAVGYWNEKENLVQTKYYDSKFMRRYAQNLLDNLQGSGTDFEKSEFIQLAMDGPTVNWNVLGMRI